MGVGKTNPRDEWTHWLIHGQDYILKFYFDCEDIWRSTQNLVVTILGKETLDGK